jgi:hypothetical protein
VGDGVLVAARSHARGDADERLLARSGDVPAVGVGAGDDLLGVREQPPQPIAASAGAAGQVVLGAAAPVELESAVGCPRAGCELDQVGGVGVQDPELDRAVALGWQGAGEQAPVGQADAAAQPPRPGSGGRGRRRGVGAGEPGSGCWRRMRMARLRL